MSKIGIIIKHEYLTRVREKSFILMTLLGPIILAILMIVPIWLSTSSTSSIKSKVMVIDESYLFNGKLLNSEQTKFVFQNIDIQTAKIAYQEAGYDYILFISSSALNNNNAYSILSHKIPPKELRDYIQQSIGTQMTKFKLSALGFESKYLNQAFTKIKLNYLELSEVSSKPSAETEATIGIFGGILLYFFIFMYGTMVMRAVMNEKQNRIIEIIVSSVKPFQLMIGKIVGVALTGITQFAVWIILSTILTFAIAIYFGIPDLSTVNSLNLGITSEVANPMSVLKSLQLIDFPTITLAFVLFFILGFFLYGSLFASIGAAVNKDSETQQFVFPLTAPLLLTFIILPEMVNSGNTAFTNFLSYFPFTSPVIMLVRVVMGVSFLEVLISMTILLFTALFFTYISGKIYKTGILSHGQTINYKTIKKWIFNK